MNYNIFQLNPEHTVPTIVDNEKTLYDSHAIACYLIDKYAKIDDLYPRDLYLRAKCNQRLFFDASILFSGFHNCSKYIFQGNCSISKQLIDVLISAYDLLEASFGNDHYLVGNKITVADISTMAIITVIDEIYVAIDPKKYIRITAWLKRMKSLDFYEEMNAKPIVQYKAFLMRKMESNK